MATLDPAALYEAYNDRNLIEFVRLLQNHPEYLLKENGTDRWMQSAAQDGWLECVKALHELGLDVNIRPFPPEDDDPDDPFLQVEGPILWAAAEGHLEVTRWFLDHGAQINFNVGGKPRCTSLEFAAQGGHLDVVKLLVERGGDYQSTNHGHNAITLAEDYGQWEVYDYLHSLGARTLRETTPREYDRTHRRIRGTKRERRGPLADWAMHLPGDPPIEIRLIPANEKSEMHSIFTVGLSDHPLPEGRWQHACCELELYLPADWPVGSEMEESAASRWPLDWLKRTAESLRSAQRMPDQPHIMMNGEPAEPLNEKTALCGWVMLPSPEGSIRAPDYRIVDIYMLFPIYREEADLIHSHGLDTFLERMLEAEIPQSISLDRPNMCHR